MTNKRLTKLSIKNLESYLQDLEDFEEPKIDLEQYGTPPHIGALMLYTIEQTYNDIDNKFVADLGCGTGRLTIGSLLCGASMVYGFDIDKVALTSTLKNIEDIFSDTDNDYQYPNSLYRDCERFNLVQVDLIASNESDRNFWHFLNNKFDTVIMNPPFGTKNNPGIDMLFLKRALDLSNNVVYSLHKTSTREVSIDIIIIIFIYFHTNLIC